MFFLFSTWAWAKFFALIVFIIASLTDYFDGYTARKSGQITNFGKLMDPIADKILILAAFLAFVELRLIPAWMVVVIIMREFFITGVRLVAVSRGIVLSAEQGGKHKTVSQVVAIFLMLIFMVTKDAMDGMWNFTFEAWFRRLIFCIMFLVAVLTITSAVSFLKKNEKLLSG